LSVGLSTTGAAVVEADDDVFTLDAIASPTDGDDGLPAAPDTTATELSGGVALVGTGTPVVCGSGDSVAVLDAALAASGVGGTGDGAGRSKFAPNIA
jgi:hypothetical protein